ncbi:Zinc finger matrin-type protein 5, partial [Operophtera brumata]
MGKRYYCDYCDKTMSCTMPIIKTHNSGLTHQKLVQEHYQKYKVETKHLAESVVTQLSFQDLYKSLQKERTCVEEAAGAALVDGSGVTHALPWAYSAELERCTELPSSIHKFKLEDFGS